MYYKGYIGVAEFDEEAQVFFGRVVNVRDTITFQSDDAKQIIHEFEVSADDYLDFCKEKGRDPEPPYREKISWRLPPDLDKQLAATAVTENKSLSELILSHVLEVEHTR
jgi:predicted HicB family RNase H-like nuclease